MSKHCKDSECKLPHYTIGAYKYHVKDKKDKGVSKPNATPKTVTAKPLKRSFIKPISDKQAYKLAGYRVVRDAYFKLHPVCEYPNCNSREITLHHKRGKVGSLLTNSRYFCSLCFTHHRTVEENPILAKELGLSLDRLSK